MASAPQNPGLPIFYQDLVPLNSRDHGTWKTRSTDKASWLIGQHAVPLTVEEFPRPPAISRSSSRAAKIRCRWR
jgi:hypothetical protein